MAAKIKKGDNVIVIAGKDKGRSGEVVRVLPVKGRAIVQGINMATKHSRPTQMSAGGIEKIEASIELSNIAIADPKDGKPTRVGFKNLKDGKKVRIARRSGEVIDA